jgi:outer membrane immunogenic protein
MRYFSIAAAAGISTLALVQLASAADLPRKAPPIVMPAAPAWTGWYAGINVGGHCLANDHMSVSTTGGFNPPGGFNPAIVSQAAAGATTTLSSGSNDRCGFIGGGQLGYNWQSANLVFGVETDIQGISGRSNFTGATAVQTNNGVPINTHIDASKRVDWLGTLRGRIGFLTTPTMLLYATGGLAYGGVKSDIAISQVHLSSDTSGTTAASLSDTRAGWTVGAGAEWMFAPSRWTAKIEYLYYDLGNIAYSAGTLNGAFTNGFVRYGITPQVSTRFDGHIVRLGLNYRF